MIFYESKGVEFRTLTEKDIPIFLKVDRALIPYKDLLKESTILDEEPFKIELDLEKAYVFLVFYEKRIAGYGIFNFKLNKLTNRLIINVDDLFFKEGYRKKKLATRFFLTLSILGKRYNCANINWAKIDWVNTGYDFIETVTPFGKDYYEIHTITQGVMDMLIDNYGGKK